MKNTIYALSILLFLINSPITMKAQNTYEISVTIDQAKENVWKVITDFNSYEQWNSILSMAENDELVIGEKFAVTIHDHGKDARFKAITLTRIENESFSAQQKIIGKWFFSATHFFILNEKDGQTQFTQKWKFTGLLSRLFKKPIFKQLELFNTMNDELKQFMEKKAA